MDHAIRIGCSGWAYKDWKGPFYPAEMKDAERLGFYQSRFSTVEINASFYRTPMAQAVENWAARAPPGFAFAWKASRFITHNKKLSDCQESVEFILERMAPLGTEAPILFQLPPSLHRNLERLATFIGWLPKGRRATFEFRHSSWYEPATYDLLTAHDLSLCISDHHAAPSPWIATASYVYVRGHGPGGRYFGSYEDAQLDDWANHIRRWRAEDRLVFGYFDNDIKSAAPSDAARLIARLDG
ncbi:MAG TPA: DUF72 domain-containing protein [Caulobacteraceae bacterium]|nr:DUF72 domain-containing protein [Caulobacteraceae bacterium]